MKNIKASSPFSALTFEEQQHQWLMWRSRHLEYTKAPIDEGPNNVPLPPIPIPDIRNQDIPLQSQNRHAQLDLIYLKHKQVYQNNLQWQRTVTQSKNFG